jgi:hypothetical protein
MQPMIVGRMVGLVVVRWKQKGWRRRIGRIDATLIPGCQGRQAQERADLGYVVRSLDPW